MPAEITRRDALRLAGATALMAVAGTAGAKEHAGHADGAAMLPGTFADGAFTLPDLPYEYKALEPLHEERTLRIHHDRHHAGYVKGLNKALAGLSAARQAGDYARIKSLSRALAFHGSGHVLHSLYWHSMTPGGAEMSGRLAKAMAASFGSVEAGKAQFAAATRAVEGSGWGVLAYEPISGHLVVLQAEKHQNLAIWGVTPLLVCDVWEHAYYLQFSNNRGLWVENFLKLANWRFAGERLAACES